MKRRRKRGAGPEIVAARKLAFARLQRILQKIDHSDETFQWLYHKWVRGGAYEDTLWRLICARVEEHPSIGKVQNVLPWTMVCKRVEIFLKGK
jgi:hypothetical protein